MPAPYTPIRIYHGASTAVDGLRDETRRRLIETVLRLQATPPEEWPADEITRANVPEPLYVLRLPPDYRIVLRRTEDNELQVENIFREEALRYWRELEERNRGARG